MKKIDMNMIILLLFGASLNITALSFIFYKNEINCGVR